MTDIAPNPVLGPSPRERLLAATDWAGTEIGPLALWPDPLKAAADMIAAAAAPMAVLWGPAGILVCNKAYASVAGARHAEVLGKRVAKAWPQLEEPYRRGVEACFAGQTLSIRDVHHGVETEAAREEVWVDIDFSPLFGPNGDVMGALAVAHRATARKLSDQRRIEAEHQLALAIDSAALAAWDYDLENQVYFWSDRLRYWFGFSPDAELSQESFRDQLHPDDKAANALAYQEALNPEGDGRYDVEFRVLGSGDRAVRWIASTGRAYFDEQRLPVRITGTAQDVTPRKHAERRQRCLVELGDRLRAAETTSAIAKTAAEVAGRALECSRAGYAMIENNVGFVEADWTNGESVSLVGPRLFGALGDPFCGPLRAGRHLVIEDVTTHPTTRDIPEPFLRIRMRSVINIPLLENGVLDAMFYVHQSEPRRWDEDEIGLVRDIADRTWEAFCRARSTQRLRILNETLEQEVALRTAQRDRMWRLSTDVMLVADPEGFIRSANPAWTTLFGWTEDELLGRNLFDLTHTDDRSATAQAFTALTSPKPPAKIESRHLGKDGSYRWLSWRAVPDDALIHAVGRDITPDREQAEALAVAEDALRQAQKMEAVGQLTGGIAHDFNNLLQGITGSLDLAEKRIGAGRFDEVEKYIAAARQSAARAATLTHRLLAFSRRQPLDPRPVEANPLVASMEDLLRRTMGEHIKLELDLDPDLWLTLCDPHQLESAILNLAINARDAMPHGGRLLITTRNETQHAERVTPGGAATAGRYISISVADTGTGMTANVLERCFEPFFTTKPLGQGTGLGLSMVYGFIRQSEGDAHIESQVGAGTIVTLRLPRFMGVAADLRRTPEITTKAQGSRDAVVLVVEDEDLVRSLVLDVLAELGLSAIAATSGPAGLEILQSNTHVDLLITDVGLPGLNGRQVADAARLTRPELRVLFMTGYAESGLAARGVLEPGVALITKPFAIEHLAERVLRMVDGDDAHR